MRKLENRGSRRAVAWVSIFAAGWIMGLTGLSQTGAGAGVSTTEALVKEAARTLKQGPPKRVKTRGKPKMARWEDLDAALAKLPEQIDYAALTARLREALSKDTGFSPNADLINEIIDKTLDQQSVRYAELFTLEDADFIPITNMVLKYLPEDAWKDVSVYTKKGEPLGTFVSKFAYEKSGGLVASKSYRVFYFQYLDKNNSQQAATADYVNRDEFCVKWGDIKDRPALTLATLKP